MDLSSPSTDTLDLNAERPKLLFVSTRPLLPVDSGGKIRTTQILRGLVERFDVTLASPAGPEQISPVLQEELRSLCRRAVAWRPARRWPLFHYTRLRYVFDGMPIPIRTDRSNAGRKAIADLLAEKPDCMVVDFLHAAVLVPKELEVPSVLFTHNVEVEIFERHLQQSTSLPMRWFWKNQAAKMRRYEQEAVNRFDAVVAVSDRDREAFRRLYGADNVHVIPTGVDLGFFGYVEPKRGRDVVFLGSMDWLPNIDAVKYFMDEIWPLVVSEVPDARMTVVGRAPPASLVGRATRASLNWRFTGFVPDVRPYVQGSAVSVIPLRIGGGTRLKVFESMAMGSPVVSTAIGVEGLPVENGRHYLEANDPADFAARIKELLLSPERRSEISVAARDHVERRFSYRNAARVFGDICADAIKAKAGASLK